jgi:hypothetical protein
MLKSSIPPKFPIPFAAEAGAPYIRSIPEPSQIGIQNGAASLTDGFPPLTFTPAGAGGDPPFGADFNGILNQITLWSQFQGAGAAVTYDAAFSAAIGGYPNGAVLATASQTGYFWLSIADNNTSDPETGGANWIKFSLSQSPTLLSNAGNPNGSVAGTQSVGGLPPTLCWDTSEDILWVCVTTGTASTAVWVNVAPTPQGPSNFENFVPNCQLQLWSGLGFITKMNSQGTGTQAAISYTGFDTVNNQPRLFTSNTGQVKVGDVVKMPSNFWGFPGSGYVNINIGARVVAVSTNASITVQGYFDSFSPVSSIAGTATPICPGDLGTGSGQCMDSWKKTGSLVVWADDFTTNSYPGALRTLGIRKGSASVEQITWECPPNQLKRYWGRTITFAVPVWQKVQSGAGTWSISTYDTIAGYTNSAAGQGNSYSNPTYGGFQFIPVTATVTPGCTRFVLLLNLSGALNDVYYAALPTAVLGSIMVQNNCRQNPNEILRPVGHWNPPILTPLQLQFPNVQTPPGSGNFGWIEIDIEAISLCTVHNSVQTVKAKVEWTTSTINATILTGTRLDYSLIFGPEATTNVANQTNCDSAWWPMDDAGCCTIFSGTSGIIPTSATFDFDMIASFPASLN